MELKYNVSGENRKKLVGAMVEILQVPQKYLGVPTCAYEIGNYHIDKTGTVTGPDNLDLEDALHQRGFDAGERKYDEPDTYESGIGGMGAAEIIDLRNCETADNNEENGTLSIEIPIKDFNQTTFDNLGKLIAGKAVLIKKALGLETLPVEKNEHKLRFEWFPYTEDPDEVNSYAQFISLLCDTAKAKKRVTAKDGMSDNPKFQMRTWLISMGAIGPDYKLMRQLLISKLPGNSAFRYAAKEKAE